VTTFTPPSPLGVGFTHQPNIESALGAGWDLVDFIEVSPDTMCVERVGSDRRELTYHPALLEDVLRCAESRPVVVHGLGLSIGSAAGWNEGYVSILDELQERQPFAWHSEHLAFLLTTTIDGEPLHAGVPLPLPFTDEAIALVAPRAAAMNARYGVPFLLENLTYYLPGLPADRGRDEVDFLNDLTERAGCGLLLDLYNFYCNAVNFGFDARAALARLRLERIVEIHVAGGAAHGGFLTDVHSRTVPEPVWELLEWVAPRAPNLCGIVYEVMEQALPLIGVPAVCRELERARGIWERHSAARSRGREVYAGA
jgi:uncharacterized protein